MVFQIIQTIEVKLISLQRNIFLNIHVEASTRSELEKHLSWKR